VRTAAIQRVGSRAALGVPSSFRLSRRNFGVVSRLRELLPSSFSSDSLCRPLALSALASLPAVTQTAAEESIETIAAVSQQFAAVAVDVVKPFSEIASTHFVSIRVLMEAMDMCHTAGLSWAGAIIALTLCLRMCLVPVLVYATKVSVRMALMKPDLDELNAEFNRRKALNGDARENSNIYSKGMMECYKKHKLNPMSPLVMPLVSMPLFFSCFFALSGLCSDGIAGMTTGGALWFPDLTAQDPYYLLPILSSWSGVLILKRGSDSGGVIDPKIAPMIKGLTVLGLFAPLITYQLPSGVLLYFTGMSVFSLLQGEIIRADATRRMLGLPTMSEMRIKRQVQGYTPFKEEAGPGVPQSLDPKEPDNKKADEDAKDKKPARKKPLPLPFRKR